MSTLEMTQQLAGSGRRVRDWLGDRILLLVTATASVVAVGAMVLIAWRVIRGAHLAYSTFGLSFVWGEVWDTNKNVFGAAPGLYGTAVTSLTALVIAAPLAIAIALFLTELAPGGVRTIIVTLVEMLAAIPSVVLGLWGILVMGPFVADHVEPWLHSWFGWLPIFSGTPSSSGVFIAGLILAIMVVPIVASICRELFLSVPRDLEEGALALGATRWEMVRGVVLHSSRPGIAAAVILGLGRALGAVAVLGVVVWSVAKRGASELSWSFFTSDLPVYGQSGGGILPLIVGSAILVGIATAIALPLGVCIAVFLQEFASPRVRAVIQLAIDLMNGLPSIIIGVFVYGLFVYGHPQHGWAASIGLSIVMLPLITRSTQEVLRLVPASHREGALALGARLWRAVRGVVLPAPLGGSGAGAVVVV